VARYFRLGNALMQQGKFSEAALCYSQELSVNPDFYQAITNLGNALRKLGRLDQAVICYQKAILLQLSHPESPSSLGVTFNNLGLAYNDLGRLEEAIASYRQAIAHSPNFVDPYVNLANPLLLQGSLEESVQISRQAIALQPDHWSAHLNLGNAYKRLGRLNDAVACFERAVSLTTDNGGAYNNLGMALRDQGKLKQAAEAFERAVAARPVFKPAYSNLLYFYAFTRHVPPSHERTVAEKWEACFLTGDERTAARQRKTSPLRPRCGRKLRIGVLTAEWFPHPVTQFLEPSLQAMDRTRLAITIFPTLFAVGSPAERLQNFAQRNGDSFIPLWGITASQAAERIRAEQIDVLMETTGHTHANRLEIVAHRAAPVQCSYLGYWSTTGLTEMDWFITGTGVPSFIDQHFTEGLWRLPRLAHCYQGDSSLPQGGWIPDPEGTIWLGSFNNNAKIREDTLSLWAKVLHALPEAKLLLEDAHVHDEETHHRITSILHDLGIEPSRIAFIPYLRGHERHMKLYDRLDIALDTIPFNSGTTAFDALWMGVPLITLAGTWLGATLAASVVQALGHPEWIAQNEEDYVSIVCTLARDLEKRKQLRQNQRTRMAKSQLCDAEGMARSLGEAFEAMYDRWSGGDPV
jgi:protein O-GlcNAc transferase